METEHVALRGNPDYQKLISCIVTLEAQREKAVKDLDRLLKVQKFISICFGNMFNLYFSFQAKEEALKDPFEFVRKLQNKEDLKLPTQTVIAQIPTIDFDYYREIIADGKPSSLDNSRLVTRNKKQNQSDQNSSKGFTLTLQIQQIFFEFKYRK